MTARDRKEFKQYLAQCTDAQVCGVMEKEHEAGREDYEALAYTEAAKRGIAI